MNNLEKLVSEARELERIYREYCAAEKRLIEHCKGYTDNRNPIEMYRRYRESIKDSICNEVIGKNF